MKEELTLWYDHPAANWKEALPVGNGRLGAMVYGHPVGRGQRAEIIQLNEETLWYGGPRDRHNPAAKEALPKIRGLLMDGRVIEAEDLTLRALQSMPERLNPYQSLAELELHRLGPDRAVADYRRDLRLETAIASTSYLWDRE